MAEYYGGIDFSGAREPLSNLWTAVGREHEGRLLILGLQPHAFRADLRRYVAGDWRVGVDADPGTRVLWGADFPFGLPIAAVDALLGDGKQAERCWPSLLAWIADRPADEVRDALPEHRREPRATDAGGALPPLDLRLYRQTVEGLRWLHELREEGGVGVVPQQPDAAAETVLIEVYPSAAARELGLPRRRMPGRPAEVRARAAALRTYLDFAHPSLEATAATLEDAWDATVACLTAWLCRDELESQPDPRPNHAALALEGWIFLPPGAQMKPTRPGANRKR